MIASLALLSAAFDSTHCLLDSLEDQEYLINLLSQRQYMDNMPGMFSCELI